MTWLSPPVRGDGGRFQPGQLGVYGGGLCSSDQPQDVHNDDDKTGKIKQQPKIKEAEFSVRKVFAFK